MFDGIREVDFGLSKVDVEPPQNVLYKIDSTNVLYSAEEMEQLCGDKKITIKVDYTKKEVTNEKAKEET